MTNLLQFTILVSFSLETKFADRYLQYISFLKGKLMFKSEFPFQFARESLAQNNKSAVIEHFSEKLK